MAKINGYELKNVRTSEFRGYVQTECVVYYNGKKLATLEDDGRSALDILFDDNTLSKEDREQHYANIDAWWLDIIEFNQLEKHLKKALKDGYDCVVAIDLGTLNTSYIRIKYDKAKDTVEAKHKNNDIKYFRSLDEFVINDEKYISIYHDMIYGKVN